MGLKTGAVRHNQTREYLRVCGSPNERSSVTMCLSLDDIVGLPHGAASRDCRRREQESRRRERESRRQRNALRKADKNPVRTARDNKAEAEKTGEAIKNEINK